MQPHVGRRNSRKCLNSGMKHFMIKENGLELSQSPQWGIWLEMQATYPAPRASERFGPPDSPPSEKKEKRAPRPPRMPVGIRMDQLEDDGFKDKEPLIGMLKRYIQEATRKLDPLIPEMRAFSANLEYGNDSDLVDRMSYTMAAIEELVKDMKEWWIPQMNKVRDNCELGRYVPRLIGGGGRPSLPEYAQRWGWYQRESNGEGRRLYQRAIDVILRLDKNIKEITDRLQEYCRK